MSTDRKIIRFIIDDERKPYAIFCPGCKCGHQLFTEGAVKWTFNGDLEKPTFTPSILCTWTTGEPPVTPENFEDYKKNPWPQTDKHHRCHSYITDGQIQFLHDCTHELKGQTVPLEPF